MAANGGANLGGNKEKFVEEADSTRPTSSGEFKLQPHLEEDTTNNSLQRNAQGFFNRQSTKLPFKPSPLVNSSLNAVLEDDGETKQDGKFEVILQPSNGAATSANNATPPALRPQALKLFKQKSTEPAQQ